MSEYIKKTSIIGLAHKMQFGRILTEREVEVVELVVNSVSDDGVIKEKEWLEWLKQEVPNAELD